MFQLYNRTKPKIFIGYDRIAYIGRDDPDLRITFDTNMRWRDYDLDFRFGDYGKPIIETDKILMGIKIPGVCPMWLARLRSAPGTAKEICAIFLAMAIGLATGMGYIGLAALLFVVAAMVACTTLVYVLILLMSHKAIEPVVKASEKQKQFITDASHELKTPITVIATSLKVLEMDIGKQKWIDKARAQTEKLTELVNSLVALSKMDEETSPLIFSEFNISDALKETAESFADFALSQGHELKIAIDEGIVYRGDEYAIRQLASIIIDNAVKYAGDGSDIEFSLEKAKNGVIIKTSNKCEGIEKGDCSKLFDRFYRQDESRSAGTGGFGIGLSIARSIAEGHCGTAVAKSDDGQNIEFVFHLK